MSAMRVRSASWVFAAQIFGKLVAFPIGIFLARALGPEGKGALSVLQLVAQTAAVLLGLGTSASFLYLAGRNELRGRDALALSVVFGGVISAFMLAAYLLIGPEYAAQLLKLPHGALLIVAVLLVGPSVVNNFMYHVVLGSGAVRNVTTVPDTSLALQLVVCAVLYFTNRLTLPVALVVWATASISEAVAVSVMGWRVKSAKGVEVGARGLFLRGYRYGIVLWVASIVGFAALRIDMFLLSAQKGTAAVGVYSIAVTFAELLWFLPTAFSAVMLPKVSGEGTQALDVTVRLERVLWPVTLVTGIAVVLGAWLVIPFLYGSAFAGAVIPLALLMPGAIAMALTTMPSAYLSGIGLPGEWTKAAALNLVVNIAANLVLIPRFGIAGAAMSSAFSYSAAAIVMVRSFVRHAGIRYRDALVPTRSDFAGFFSAATRVLRRAD